MIWWAWTNFDEHRAAYERAMNDPTWENLAFVRLRTPKETNACLGMVEVGEQSVAARGEDPE